MRRRIRPRSTRRGAAGISFLEALESRALLAGDLVISEFMARNTNTIADEDGDFSDWIEIYNRGDAEVSLDGWYLTDDTAELDKWAFPAQSVSAGSVLLVRASGKNRAVAGHELHTNFQLQSEGEFLALVHEVETPNAPDTLQIVSSYDVPFPNRSFDVSYGIGQQVQIQSLITNTNRGRAFFPTSDALGQTWIQPDFVDQTWLDVANGIGYETAVPGFTVLDARSTGNINNLANADAVLSGVGVASQKTIISPVVDFYDAEGGGGTGNFGNPRPFPNNTNADDNDFAIRATATVIIPSAGTWTFGVNSDDGSRLRIDGRNVILDDTQHAPENRFGRVDLTAGAHTLELVFFERGGGAEVELFAAKGSFTTFQANAFRLVGDVANGGLAVETNPGAGGATGGFADAIQTDIQNSMWNKSAGAYLRIPFLAAPDANRDSLALRVQYDDGFVAYLNGVEVARRNAPETTRFDSVATLDRAESSAILIEDIDISQHLPLLRTNQINVLAIHGLNDSVGSDEFLLSAQLADMDVQPSAPVYFTQPSPGALNEATGLSDFLIDEITLSHPHGFYEAAFQLTLSAKTAGTTIRYTLDGTEPRANSGIVYSGPIAIDRTTTVRARAFKTGVDPSNIETATYLFLQDVVRQSPTGAAPTGFPTSLNINGQVLDYGMDPDIVNSATWGPQLNDALRQIPSMSIVMNVNDLLGTSQGIYTNAQNHGSAWERPVSLELLQPDGSEGFQINAGLRVRGGYSRSSSNPKHAFRLFFRNEYGAGKLDFPLFGDEGVNEFDSFDLRTTQNYSWAFDGSGSNTFVRDVFSRDVQGLMGQPYTRSRYYHLYINGQYWGLYQTEERPEASFAASYMGGNPEDYDVVKSAGSNGGYQNEATDGTMESYQRLANFFYQAGGLSDANMASYWRAQGMNPDGTRNANFERLLDVDNLIDYMIITYYTSDADGPGSKFTRPAVNNYFAIYNRENPDGFKFMEHDSEHSLDRGDAAGAGYNMVTPLTTGGAQFQYFNPHWMHEQLAASNSAYRQRFADRVYKHLFNDGILTPQRAKALIDARTAQFDRAIVAESARWGDSKRATPYTKNDWINAVNSVKNFFDNRTPVVIEQLRGQGWYPADDPPRFTINGVPNSGGRVDKGVQLGLFTTSNVVFSDLVAAGSSWKYLDNGSDQGTAWRTSAFNDSGWKTGTAQFGYGDGDEQTTVGFGPNSNSKYATTYFRRNFTVNNPGQYQTLRLRLLRDDGAIVYLNGEEIARSNMRSGDVRFDEFALGTVSDENVFLNIEVDVARLRAGENVLAVEIHQGNATSSDLSFDLSLQGGSSILSTGNLYYTLDGSDPRQIDGSISPLAVAYAGPVVLDRTAMVRARLRNGNQWSALSEAQFLIDAPASASSLAITEINYNPHAPLTSFGEANVDNDLFEYIELMNTSASRIDLTGVMFTLAPRDAQQEGIEFEFASEFLEPSERIVVVRDRAAFASRYGTGIRIAQRDGVPLNTGTYSGALDNSGEQLTLKDINGQIIRQFTYSDSGNWPGRADGGASSLELTLPTNNVAQASSWRNSHEFGGSPGRAGTGVVRDVVINELLTHTDPPLLDSIELHNTTSQPITVGGWYISDSGANYLRYRIAPQTTVIPAGGYLVIDESQLGFGFRGEASDDAWLIAADASGKPLRFADRVEFSATENGVTLGRWPDGIGSDDFFPMLTRTLGEPNDGPRLANVVLSEVHYHPPLPSEGSPLTQTDLEFVEIWNRSGQAVDIGYWRLNRAIEFTFPAGTNVAADERLAVLAFDPALDAAKTAAFRATFGLSPNVRLLGPFQGLLDSNSDVVELERPEDLAAIGVGNVLVDRVAYSDTTPWPATADGQGMSLHRVVPVAYGDSATSWIAVPPTPGFDSSEPPTLPGDFNDDQVVDIADIQLFCEQILNPTTIDPFDLNDDNQVTLADHAFLITSILKTSPGDANLDGVFDSTDLVLVFQSGKYEDGIARNATWAEGDWDCDGEFTTADLVAAFQSGAYQSAADLAIAALLDEGN